MNESKAFLFIFYICIFILNRSESFKLFTKLEGLLCNACCMHHTPLAARQKVARYLGSKLGSQLGRQVARQVLHLLVQQFKQSIIVLYSRRLFRQHIGRSSTQVTKWHLHYISQLGYLASYFLTTSCQIVRTRQKFMARQLPTCHTVTELHQTKKCLMKLVQVIICFAIFSKLLLCLTLVASLIFLIYVHLLYLFASCQQ